MTRALRTAVALLSLPFAFLLNAIRPGIRILMYHRVTPDVKNDQLTISPDRFEEQIKLLSKSENIISLEQAVGHLRKGRISRRSIVITFDDGYLDNLQYAAPILERYQVPCTIFVTSDFCSQVAQHPRYKPANDRLHLNWHEVRQISAKSGFTIGSHTVTHPYLQQVSNDAARQEISESKTIIQREIGTSVDFFCYPSGDVGQREEREVMRSGYVAAVTVAPGINRFGINPFLLKRTEMTERDGVLDTRLKIWGAYDLIHKILHARRKHQFKKLSAATINAEG